MAKLKDTDIARKMSPFRRIVVNIRYKRWGLWLVFVATMAYGVFSRLGIARKWFRREYVRVSQRMIDRRFRVHSPDGDYYDVAGVKIAGTMRLVNFEDLLMPYAWFSDPIDARSVEFFDSITDEGRYCYDNGEVRVDIQEGDIVIDAGASIGEFSAYAAKKGAVCYAFEPTSERFADLERTAKLNEGEKGRIIPVKMGLSNFVGTALISMDGECPTMVGAEGDNCETIRLTTLDEFVRETGLERVDFIKSDIEGAERDMLRGAKDTMRMFAPKLSICTYHLPDDPEMLAGIIADANPKYKLVQRKKKMVASI